MLAGWQGGFAQALSLLSLGLQSRLELFGRDSPLVSSALLRVCEVKIHKWMCEGQPRAQTEVLAERGQIQEALDGFRRTFGGLVAMSNHSDPLPLHPSVAACLFASARYLHNWV